MKINTKRIIANDLRKLKNRLKQGVAAGIGSSAILASTAIKVLHQNGYSIRAASVGKFSIALGAAIGAAWALTPPAKEDPADTIAKTKSNLQPLILASFKKMAEGNYTPEESDKNKYAYTEVKSNDTYERYESKGYDFSIDGIETLEEDEEELEIVIDDDIPIVLNSDGEIDDTGTNHPLALVDEGLTWGNDYKI